MFQVTFTVPGKSVGQPRQRFRMGKSKTSGKAIPIAFRPAKSPVTGFKEAIRIFFENSRPDGWPLTDDWGYRLLVLDRRKPSKTLAKKLKGKSRACLFKPDADNVLKAIKDALKEVAWKDDCQVYDERCIKVWKDADETEGLDIVLIAEPADQITAAAALQIAKTLWPSQTVAT